MAKNIESYNATGRGLDADVNVKQGPRTGNSGNAEKRAKFVAAKNGGEKQALADQVLAALELRGIKSKPYIDPAVEPLDANRGPKVNPTANGSRLPKGAKRPQTKG